MYSIERKKQKYGVPVQLESSLSYGALADEEGLDRLV